MLKNASLSAENNLLKQQIVFLQKLVMRANNDDDFIMENASKSENGNKNNGYIENGLKNIFDNNSQKNENNYILPLSNSHKLKEDFDEEVFRVRIPSLTNSRKHMMIFGVMTILIFIFSVNMGESGGEIQKNKISVVSFFLFS